MNVLQRDVNVVHLTWMSLHYLVKLEMLMHRACATIELLDKLHNLSNLNCGIQIRQI